MSDRSAQRFAVVRDHYERWQEQHPADYPEQYMGCVYDGTAGQNPPRWEWVVEYVSAVIASAGTPPGSLNRNARYSNRVNRLFDCAAHQKFWSSLTGLRADISVITTNYDILVERVLRHRQMLRPPSPGCYYGGFARPQCLRGVAQISRSSTETLIEMTGTIPIYKLHGSLNWSLSAGTVTMYQDMRPAYRHGGTAAIIPPIPEKSIPSWLDGVWRAAVTRLQDAGVWIVVGYSLPSYDAEILALLRRAGSSRPLVIFLLDPNSTVLRDRWLSIIPQARIVCLPGMPEGINELAGRLADAG